MEANAFRERLSVLATDGVDADSGWCVAAVRLAIEAGEAGNIGIGAVVVDPAGQICATGQNRLFRPSFRSDLHAEMDALDRFEDRPEPDLVPGEYQLFSSLEPCPMCLTRILFSGVHVVRYAVSDPGGGMVSGASGLPPVFAAWAADRDMAPADIDPALATLAAEVHEASLPTALARLEARWQLLGPQ